MVIDNSREMWNIVPLTETNCNGKGRDNDLSWNIILTSYEQGEIDLVI